jgi:release factor glutamine methyltransferase
VLHDAGRRLAAAGVPSPDHDAAVLLAHAAGIERRDLWRIDEIDAGVLERYARLVDRRADREPLQHLTGSTAFRHVELAVGPGVFVPRPETELLAGWAVEAVSGGRARPSPPVVVDLCTGSGAIALSLATEVPHAEVHALELDEGAHAWATRNLAGSGVDLRQGDLAAATETWPELVGQVDVVVCNPPYVPLEAWESVAAEARDHDPHLALFSGHDGLDAIRELERVGARLLRPGGALGFEHADVQGDSAPAVLAGSGRWSHVVDHLDLAGRPRFTTAVLAR